MKNNHLSIFLVVVVILSSLAITLFVDYFITTSYFSKAYFSRFGFKYIPLKGLLIFSFMLFGMIAKAIFEELKNKKKVDLLKSVRNIFMKPGVWKSFLVSPIIFGCIYTLTKQPLDVENVLPLLVAFQNGFFWQTVLEKVNE